MIEAVSGQASQLPIDDVIARVLAVYRKWNRNTSVAEMRADWDRLFDAVPADAPLEQVATDRIRGGWVDAPGAALDRVTIYLHGGGFRVGSLRSHHELMAAISREAGCRVFGLDYRLAPEHAFPAALDDTCAAYEWLLDQNYKPQNIAIAGDSAGAGLAVSALLRLKTSGIPLPGAAVLMSLWSDMTASGQSYQDRAEVDPIHQRPMIRAMAQAYLGGIDPRDPSVSPLFGALEGLPSMLLQVGDRETLLSDSTSFADKARACGIDVSLEVWPNMIHVFQQFPNDLIEARQALQSIGAFLRTRLGQQQPFKDF